MKTFRRMTAIILVICMTLGLFGFDSSVFAANPMAVEINVESATTNTVTLNWNTVVGTASVNITSGNPNINITLKNLPTRQGQFRLYLQSWTDNSP